MGNVAAAAKTQRIEIEIPNEFVYAFENGKLIMRAEGWEKRIPGARSILVSTPRKVVIEGNTFSSIMSAILFEGDMSHWYESGAVRDVTVRNNRFLDGTYGDSVFLRRNSVLRSAPEFTAPAGSENSQNDIGALIAGHGS